MDAAREQRVIAIIAEQTGVDAALIARESRFAEDLNMDSLDAVEAIMKMEEEFEFSVPDEEAEKLKTVGQMLDYVASHRPASADK